MRADLTRLPGGFDFRVLCGLTGCGKTRLLQALAAEGAQVLDLEGLAAHRGSVLGALPHEAQPSQKGFDTQLWRRLRELDPARPVFVESESRKIGRIMLPVELLQALHQRALPVWIQMPEAGRVELLLQDYAHFADNPESFCQALDALIELRGRQRITNWQEQARAGHWAEVFGALIREHYDPGYGESLHRNFPRLATSTPLALADGGPAAMRAAAQLLIESYLPA